MNSGSISQKKAPFGSDQLVKFVVFAQKCMPTNRALSSRTEGTNIVIRRSKGTCWGPESVVEMARDAEQHYGATTSVSTTTAVNGGVWKARKLGLATSGPSEAKG